LRLAVHNPAAVADRLEAVLFAHPVAGLVSKHCPRPRLCTTPSKAPIHKPANLLQRLAVQEDEADADDVMIRLVERAGQRALVGIQADLRQAEPAEQAGFAPTVSWLKLALETLRTEAPAEHEAALEAERRLVVWLMARDEAERHAEATL